MKKILLKILEAIALAGMVVFLGFLFLIELIDLFIVRPIYQKLFKKEKKEKKGIVKIEFEKQFGKGVDPWYAKAERWIKKKFRNPYLQHLALGFLEWLKQKWIDTKVFNTMRDVDIQVEEIKKDMG